MRDAAPAQREIVGRAHAVAILVWTQSGAVRALRWLLVALTLILLTILVKPHGLFGREIIERI